MAQSQILHHDIDPAMEAIKMQLQLLFLYTCIEVYGGSSVEKTQWRCLVQNLKLYATS